MKRAMKFAGFGLLTGAAVTLAAAGAASAHDGKPRFSDRHGPEGRAPLQAPVTFAELDADGNGLITEEDLTARAAARFAEADTDGNGSVTLEELTAAFTAKANERLADAEDKPSDLQVAARAERMAERMIERGDADDNGTLEAAEMQPKGGFGRMIDKLDTDDDNAVSEAEFDEMKDRREAMMERRGQKGDRHGPRGGHQEGPRY